MFAKIKQYSQSSHTKDLKIGNLSTELGTELEGERDGVA